MRTFLKRLVLFAILGFLAVFVVIITVRPAVDIRIDCGDRRYRYIGIPLWHDHLEKQYREILISVAKDAGISSRWVRIAPPDCSNDNIGEYRDRYLLVAIWAHTDKTLGALLLKDVSTDIDKAAGKVYASAEPVRFILQGIEPDLVVLPDWTKDPNIQEYCKTHGYIRPEWSSSQQLDSQSKTAPMQ